jgi:hypothetical protein
MLLIAFSFNRGGMLAFIVPAAIYVFKYRFDLLKRNFIKFSTAGALLIVLFLVLSSSSNGGTEDFQGRSAGITQLSSNIKSIFVTDTDDPLGGNKVWRLLWWYKIVGYTFGGQYFLYGKGLGVNLAISDEIPADMWTDLRSPHNFSMTILARFGVIIFFVWIAFIVHFLITAISKHHLQNLEYAAFSLILVSFIINSMFDVYLEGPMAAFPFWTFVGLIVPISATKKITAL